MAWQFCVSKNKYYILCHVFIMSGIIKLKKYFFSDDDKNLHGCSARSGIGSSATDWNLAEDKSLNNSFESIIYQIV